MYTYMYVYMYICLYVYVYVCSYVFTFICPIYNLHLFCPGYPEASCSHKISNILNMYIYGYI